MTNDRARRRAQSFNRAMERSDRDGTKVAKRAAKNLARRNQTEAEARAAFMDDYAKNQEALAFIATVPDMEVTRREAAECGFPAYRPYGTRWRFTDSCLFVKISVDRGGSSQ